MMTGKVRFTGSSPLGKQNDEKAVESSYLHQREGRCAFMLKPAAMLMTVWFVLKRVFILDVTPCEG